MKKAIDNTICAAVAVAVMAYFLAPLTCAIAGALWAWRNGQNALQYSAAGFVTGCFLWVIGSVAAHG